MKRNDIPIEFGELQIWELCKLFGEIANRELIGFLEDMELSTPHYMEGLTLKVNRDYYAIESEKEYVTLIDQYNEEFIKKDSSNKILYLYENMMGITNNSIIYPGITSCIGITVVLSNNVKLGAHLVLPIEGLKMQKYYKYCIGEIIGFYNLYKDLSPKIYIAMCGNDGLETHIQTLKQINEELFDLFREHSTILGIEICDDGTINEKFEKVCLIENNDGHYHEIKHIDAVTYVEIPGKIV